MNSLFRRPSYSLLSSSAKRVLSYLLFTEHIRSPSAVTPHQPSPSALPSETRDNLGFGLRWRGFSTGTTCLGFRATDGLAAQPAIDDYTYDEKTQGNSGEDEGLEIAKLGIAEVIVKELAKRGITRLFPIQRAVLEPAMEGRDMIGRARTGTGKTLAFGIPIMDKIIKFNTKHERGRNPMALVLAPTRELAKQVEKEFKESSDLDTICVYGGSPIAQQMSALDYGVDVVVGTPGRVIDLLKRGALNLSEVQFVVLDEADQMLAVGFADDVETILEKLPTKRQSMMFSATMPSWIRQLTRKYLVDPLTIDLVGDSDQKLAEGITLYSIISDNYGKSSIIGPLVAEHAKGGKCIIFTQTKRDADRLSYSLGRNLKCEALHGDISQAQRERTLSGFREGHFNVLVATDVAARGLDIPNVDLVIHYELPNSSEIFVHRSGRTGRAGKKGNVILIHSEFQVREMRTIEQHVGCKFTELPKITVESGASNDMLTDMGSGRFGSSGIPRMGDSGFRRAGGSGSGYGGSSQFGGYGDSGSGRSSVFGGSRSGFAQTGGFGRSGDSGGSARSSGYGDSGRFGNSRQPGGFGISNSGSKGSDSSRFGGSNSSRFSFND